MENEQTENQNSILGFCSNMENSIMGLAYDCDAVLFDAEEL